MKSIDVELEQWPGSPVFHSIKLNPKERAAKEFRDSPARLTARQAVFLRNLISLAEVLQSSTLPIVFQLNDHGLIQMDHGCIKIAEIAGFIQPLRDNDVGFVDSVTLNFTITLGAQG